MMDHSSARWFSTGVPVRASRVRAGIARTACACRVPLFLIAWASSQTTRPQRDVAQRAQVAQRGAVGGDDQVGRRPPRRELLVALAGAAVVHVDPQARREPGGLLLPVADQRHRADRAASAPGVAPSVALGRAAATGSARSCRGPCRRPGCRPARAGRGSCSQDRPRSWYGRSVPWKPAGVGIGVSRSAACPESRSPSMPSASTSTSGRSSSPPSTTCCSTSPAVSSPSRRRPTALSAALSCRSSSSTHCPRTRTSGTLSRASSASSSAADRAVADHQVDPEVDQLLEAEPGVGGGLAGRLSCCLVRVVSLSPTALRPAQAGSCTPKPAACSSGAACRRNSCASRGAQRHAARAAARSSASCSAGKSRTARPEPGQQRLVGARRQAGHPAAGPQRRRRAGRGWDPRRTAGRTPAPSRPRPAPARSAGS